MRRNVQICLWYRLLAIREFSDDYAIEAAKDLKASGYLKAPEGKDSLTVVVVSGLRDEEGGTNRIEISKI